MSIYCVQETMEEHVPTGQSNDRDEPPGKEPNYDMEMLEQLQEFVQNY